jgi:lipopolysaccharide/colanic/teichoic acid biosynthesis glycosyltransferase
MTKRLFDIILSMVGLIILAPMFLVIAVAIKIDSPGTVLYKGVRTGIDGKPFRMLKFRTMVMNAEVLGGPSTGRCDPRITRIGRFLRRYKLDELPQLVNVLIGDMSIVGPRPEVPQYTALYEGDERLILSVRPGITDYSSVVFANLNDLLGDEDPDRVYEEQVRPIKNALRIRYVREAHLLTDVKIVIMTFLRLLGVNAGGLCDVEQYRPEGFTHNSRM